MNKINLYSEKKIDIYKISNLFSKSFNKKFDDKYWQWRFLSNPNKEEIFISYIENNNQLVAYYAVSPMTINIENKGEFKVALSNMTMTHPDYQGRGYFKSLANNLYSELKSKGFIGVYGFANQSSHYGFRKYFNWKDLAILNNFCVSKENFRNFLLQKKEDLNVFIEKITTETLKKIESYSFSSSEISIKRDYNNLKWRFYDNPTNQYLSLTIKSDNLEVIIIYKKFIKSIDIMEIFCNTENIELKSINLMFAFDMLLSQHCEKINIWSNLYSFEHLMLEKFGFTNDTFNTYFGFIPFTSQHKELLNIENWHYRFCDSDVY